MASRIVRLTLATVTLAVAHASEVHMAAATGDEAKVRSLLDDDHDPNAVDNDNPMKFVPLHLAALQGHEAIAELLVDRGASVSMADRKGNQPLHYTVIKNHPQVASLLLKHGADIEARNGDGNTPLLLAASDVDTAQMASIFLRDYGADPQATNNLGQSAWDLATLHRNFLLKAELRMKKDGVVDGSFERYLQSEGWSEEDVDAMSDDELKEVISKWKEWEAAQKKSTAEEATDQEEDSQGTRKTKKKKKKKTAKANTKDSNSKDEV